MDEAVCCWCRDQKTCNAIAQLIVNSNWLLKAAIMFTSVVSQLIWCGGETVLAGGVYSAASQCF